MMPLDQDLSDAELERFLASPGLVETSMDVVGLDGFFASVLASPRVVRPSEWTPWIWDVDRGDVSPDFEDLEEAQRTLGLVMRLYNSVARALISDSAEFEPLFVAGDSDAASAWRAGFLTGMRFDPEAWEALMLDKPKWFAPILGLAFEDEEGPLPRKSQIERWTRAVGPAVAKIHAYWFKERQARPPGVAADRFAAGPGQRSTRSARGAGRNHLCPCGSSRKFKRCCGAKPATPS
jgi:uncharacterized protein